MPSPIISTHSDQGTSSPVHLAGPAVWGHGPQTGPQARLIAPGLGSPAAVVLVALVVVLVRLVLIADSERYGQSRFRRMP
jgi:hypothetical protein